MEAVVLAGGKGSGMHKLTMGKSKLLIEILGKPIIEWVLTNVLNAGVRNVTLITDRPQAFEDVTTKLGSELSFDVRLQREEEVLGALEEAVDKLSSKALLVYGDTLIPSSAYKLVIEAYEESGLPTLLVIPDEDVTRYGAIYINEQGFIEKFVERPKYVETSYVFGGVAILNRELVNSILSAGRIDEGVNSYVRSGGKIQAVIWSDWWVDIGSPVDILKALYYVLKDLRTSRISSNAKIASSTVIEGPVIIEEGAEVDHHTLIKGPAYVGRGSFIGAYSFIRPFTDVEAEASIGSYVEVVWSLVGRKASIGRESFIGFSVVGEEAVVEPNVKTKLLIKPEVEGVRAMKVRSRRVEYLKLGSMISAKARIPSGTELLPGEER